MNGSRDIIRKDIDILMAHLDESYPEDVTYETVEWGVAGWVTHEADSADREYLDEFDLEHLWRGCHRTRL